MVIHINGKSISKIPIGDIVLNVDYKNMVIRIKQFNGEIRIIGFLDKNVFTKYVKQSKHLYRKLDAWGIDAKIFTDVLKGQANTIKVIDKETGKNYKTDIATFEKQGQFLHFKPYRAQIFLSIPCECKSIGTS